MDEKQQHCLFEKKIRTLKTPHLPPIFTIHTSNLTGVYILRPKSTNPPPFPVLQTSPKHTFSQKFNAVFRAFRGKFEELGCKIYTPHGFLMLIQLFLYLLLIFYVHFPLYFVTACYFPLFCKSWEVTNFPLAYKIPPPRGGGGGLM